MQCSFSPPTWTPKTVLCRPFNTPLQHEFSARYSLEERSAYNALVSINRCSADVLSEIMTQALPDGPELVGALRLASVCRQWRDIALSLTELWDTLNVNFKCREYEPRKTRRDDPRDMAMAEGLLNRSGQTGLLSLQLECILIAFTSRYYQCPFPEPIELLDMLTSVTDRLGSLDLCIPESWFQSFQDQSFAHLQHLRLRPLHAYPRITPWGTPLQVCVFNWATPMLKSVELHGIDMLSMGLPWYQLTHITLFDTRPEGFLEVLPLCENAVDIRVRILWGACQPMKNNPPKPEEALCLPRLKSLLLYAEDAVFQDYALAGIAAPQLQCLTTNLLWDCVDKAFAAMRSFVMRSGLQRLTLKVNFDQSKMDVDLAQKYCEALGDQTMVPIEFVPIRN